MCSVLSKTQHTKDVLSSLLKLWKDFFNSVPSDIVEKLLETLDYRIVSMHRAGSMLFFLLTCSS